MACSTICSNAPFWMSCRLSQSVLFLFFDALPVHTYKPFHAAKAMRKERIAKDVVSRELVDTEGYELENSSALVVSENSDGGLGEIRNISSSCDKFVCSNCVEDVACVWCGGIRSGQCQPESAACSKDIAAGSGDCPDVETLFILVSVLGILAGAIGLGIVLNLVSRYQRNRKKRKMKAIIVALPSYAFRSTTVAPVQASPTMALIEGPGSGGIRCEEDRDQTVTVEEKAKAVGEEEEGTKVTLGLRGDSSSCAICMTDYAAPEVVKVLPCGHNFHSSCLEPWLMDKAICPLCKVSTRHSTCSRVKCVIF
ncbi:unnamed protein product [Choristocarpus tenellus]